MIQEKIDLLRAESETNDDNDVDRVFLSNQGTLRLKSLLNFTSRSIATDLNLVQGSFLEPGRVREVVSTEKKHSGTGKCRRTYQNATSTRSVCTNFAQGFLGFWEPHDEEREIDDNEGDNDDDTVEQEQSTDDRARAQACESRPATCLPPPRRRHRQSRAS